MCIRDSVNAGRIRILTMPAAGSGQYDEGSAFSPDGKSIAYGWYTNRNDFWELRVIDRNGGRPRTVSTGDRDGYNYIWPVAWTPDGESVLVVIEKTPTRSPHSR